MYIVLVNYLLLLNTSVAGELTIWVSIILLVSVVIYLLLKKLNDLQDDVAYGENDTQYIPAERLKSRFVNDNDTLPPPAAKAATDNAPITVDQTPEPVPSTSIPFVEYISVAKPKAAEAVAEQSTGGYTTGSAIEQSWPQYNQTLTATGKEDIPETAPLAEHTVAPHVDQAERGTAFAFAEQPAEPVFIEEPVTEHIADHADSIDQLIADHVSQRKTIDEQEANADDLVAEHHTEAIPADELIVPKDHTRAIDVEKHAAEPIFSEKIPAPVLVTKAPAAPPAFNEQRNISDAVIINPNPDINAVLNSLSDIIFEYDEHKCCVNLWYNKSQSTAIDLEIFRGKTVTEAMGPEKAKVINDAIDLVAASIKPTIIEFPSFYGPGKWFRSNISPVFDDNYNFTGHTTSLVTDISEQRLLDAELLQKHLLVIAAQKIARLGNWMYDLVTKQTTWSDNLYALLDLETLPENTNHFDYYISHVVADDRRAVYQFFADVAGDKHLINHHRVLTDKSNLKYFRIVRGEPVKDASGNIIADTGIIQDVSENQEIERNIRKTQAELSEAQAIAKIGNWKWYAASKELTLTAELYKIYELDTHVLDKGISPFKLLLKFVHPDDKAALLGLIKNPANMGRTSREYRIITASGQLKYLCLFIARINQREDGRVRTMAGTLQDITERKEAELNIQHTDDNYKLVLEGIKLAAVSLDKNGEIIFCNKYLADLLGYQQQELTGLNWYDKFISENLIPVFKEWYQNNHFKTEYVSPVICRNGEERVISWQNTTLYTDDGQIKQTTSIGEDVTNQQKDRELLLSAKEQAERSSQFKSDFMSVMSHEIRTPMNAVIGTTNLLLDDNPRPDQLDYLHNLKSSGENLLDIIDNILDYNTIETGKLKLDKTHLNIDDLTAGIRQTFLPVALEKNIGLFIETDNHIPKNLIGDPIRLGQILTNLVSNAIKFTNKGSVTLSIQEAARNYKRVKLNFSIADTGIGIDQKDLQKIFEPFVQQTQPGENGGKGLGLALIKRLVELHGSKIDVKSNIGRGTQFTFTIEFEYTAEPIAKPQTITPAPPPVKTDLSGMKVLVVDDNKLNMLIACRFLDKWQVTTNEASDGHMATEMADSNTYDLILMDLQMPVMDGFEASKIIKEKHPDMPIIALTADAMPETFAKTVEYNFDDYLVKPFMPEVLFEKVSRFYKG